MTMAKLSIFVESDGNDAADMTPIVRITRGKPEYHEALVRNATGVADIRARPAWRPGWQAVVRIRFDADQFDLESVANLLMRAGTQVGIGEGRPDSKKSNGTMCGLFTITKQEATKS